MQDLLLLYFFSNIDLMIYIYIYIFFFSIIHIKEEKYDESVLCCKLVVLLLLLLLLRLNLKIYNLVEIKYFLFTTKQILNINIYVYLCIVKFNLS